jgi:hypothetical protein
VTFNGIILNLPAGATFFGAAYQKRITAASNPNMAKQGNNQIKATRYASVPLRLNGRKSQILKAQGWACFK